MKFLATSAILTLSAMTIWGATDAEGSATATADAVAAKPKAVVAEPILDLGIVPKGDQADAEFVIRNEGTAPLEITEVRPACGCTVARYDKLIAPGAEGKISATLDTTNLYGANSKTVTVFTNDAENPSLVLTIKSDVKPYINAVPGYARFNVVRLEEEGIVTQTLWPEDGSDFNIVSVEAPYGFMKTAFRLAKDEEKDENGKGRQWLVDLKLAPDAPVGALTKHLVITTDHPKQKTVKIPVSGFVRPVVAVSPPTADFRKIEQAETKRTNILVRNFATENIKVTGVKSNIGSLKAYLVSVEEGRRYRVNLEMAPEMPKGPFSGTLTIKTDSPKVPELQVEVKGDVI